MCVCVCLCICACRCWNQKTTFRSRCPPFFFTWFWESNSDHQACVVNAPKLWTIFLAHQPFSFKTGSTVAQAGLELLVSSASECWGYSVLGIIGKHFLESRFFLYRHPAYETVDPPSHHEIWPFIIFNHMQPIILKECQGTTRRHNNT